jgi:type IV pilus assembly protein PilA
MTQSENKGTPVVLWILAGCGCLGFGMVVLGILAAIALPSFLNQASKAKQSEARNYVGAMLRGQQAHFIEKQSFATSLDALQLGIPTATQDYQYTIETFPGPPQNVLIRATPLSLNLKGFIGVVAEAPNQPGTTITVLCESTASSMLSPLSTPELSQDGNQILCAGGTQPAL